MRSSLARGLAGARRLALALYGRWGSSLAGREEDPDRARRLAAFFAANFCRSFRPRIHARSLAVWAYSFVGSSTSSHSTYSSRLKTRNARCSFSSEADLRLSGCTQLRMNLKLA